MSVDISDTLMGIYIARYVMSWLQETWEMEMPYIG